MANTNPYIGMTSPDGRWQWNGEQWLPLAQQPQSQGTSISKIVGALVIFALILGAAFLLVTDLQRSQQVSDNVDGYACQYYGQDCG